MPVLRFARERLFDALGPDASDEKVAEQLAMMGCVPEETGAGEWAVEVFPDRPDLLSAELLGRSLRSYMGREPGLTRYDVAEPTQRIRVDESVEPVRPVLVAGAASGLELDEDRLTGLIDLQEDLHWGLGARRRKVSVGIHDAGDIEPPFTYKAVDPDTVSFVPLRGASEMTMREMIKELEKGVEYAHLVEGHDAWPLIEDDAGEVLSFPPIINGTRTTVTERTTDVFVDVTGTDERACLQVLNIVMTHLAELGAELEAVEIERPEETLALPELSPFEQRLSLDRARDLLGVDLGTEEAIEALERMGLGARADGDELVARVGAWRSDILHEVDLVEDVAIGLGYDRFEGEDPHAVTYGTASETERFDAQLRRCLEGFGYLECMTLSLRAREEQTDAIGAQDPIVAVENPVSQEQAVLRRRLLPGLLTLASRNTHRDLPQKLFEVGDVILPPEDDSDGPRNERRVAGIVVAPEAGFTRVKSHVEGLLRALDLPIRLEADDAPGFVAGRCARVERKDAGTVLGHLGEIAPATLETFELSTPCAGFELRFIEASPRGTWSPAEEQGRVPGTEDT